MPDPSSPPPAEETYPRCDHCGHPAYPEHTGRRCENCELGTISPPPAGAPEDPGWERRMREQGVKGPLWHPDHDKSKCPECSSSKGVEPDQWRCGNCGRINALSEKDCYHGCGTSSPASGVEPDEVERLREQLARSNDVIDRTCAALAGQLTDAGGMALVVQHAADLRAEVASLTTEYRAAASLCKQRTEELDTLREWCKAQGHLPADLPSPTSFDRELRKRLSGVEPSQPEGLNRIGGDLARHGKLPSEPEGGEHHCPACGQYVPLTLDGTTRVHDCDRTPPQGDLPPNIYACPKCAGHAPWALGCWGTKENPHEHCFMQRIDRMILSSPACGTLELDEDEIRVLARIAVGRERLIPGSRLDAKLRRALEGQNR